MKKQSFILSLFLILLMGGTSFAAEKLLWSSASAGKNGVKKMSFWSSKNFKGKRFTLPGKNGEINGFEIAADSKDESATLIVHLPAVPGRTYIIRVKAKAEKPNEDSKIYLMGVAQGSGKTIGVLPRKLIAPIYHKYAEYELITKAPGGRVWDQTKRIQFSFCARNLKGGKIFFDNIRILEKQ